MEEAYEEIIKDFCESNGYSFGGIQPGTGYFRLDSHPDNLLAMMESLYRDNRFWCDFLISIAGEHIPGSPALLKLYYHLNSLPKGWKIQVACTAELTDSLDIPVFPSLTPLWKAAGWHERETAELFGVHFEGHPDLRKLLLPANWEGFPLRKDYLPQEKYHGVKVKY